MEIPLVIYGVIGLVVLLGLIFVGVPIAFAMLALGFFGMLSLPGVTLNNVMGLLKSVSFVSVANYDFTALPLFVLMGFLIISSGIAGKVYDAAAKWIGRIPGGLGLATVASCTAFGTLSGSSLITAIIFTRVSVPEMRRHGYEKGFASGLTCASGVIGMLIPPSVAAIVYGIISGDSIGKLMMAGLGPGILVAVLFAIGIVIWVKLKPELAPLHKEKVTWREKFASLKDLWMMGVIAVLMLGGLFAGIFTATEAAAVGTVGSFFMLILLGKFQVNVIKQAVLDTAAFSAMLFLLLIGVTLFVRFIALTGVATALVEAIVGAALPSLAVLLLLMLLYIGLGTIMDFLSMLVLTLPIILPVVDVFGWDRIWFAMLVIITINIGTLTPPIGLTVYGAKAAADPDITLEDLFKNILPFVVLLIVALILCIFIPDIAIGITRWM